MAQDGKAIESLARDERRLIDLGERLRSMPERGFREFATAALAAEELASVGAEVETGLAVTGLRGSLGPAGAPEIVLLADLDALPTAGAPGGVAHSCGHNAQTAIMLSVFRALALAKVPQTERIRLVFIGAPAEEYADLDYRRELREKGAIRLFSGKQELIRLGCFDHAAAVLKYHSMPDEPLRVATVNGVLNGFMAKRATFLGAPAHAGAWPERGVNALNAASLAMLAIHAQRETFRDQDHVRVHPIMREGGLVVTTVPERAVLETFVRAASYEAVLDAAAKVDRALAAGAVAIGAKVRIEDLPGYMPFAPCPALGEVLGRAALARLDASRVDFADRSTASDDIGDVASVAPTCQLGYSGFRGTIHGADFEPSDLRRAYVEPALILAQAALELAADGGAAALAARASFAPRFDRAGYEAAVLRNLSDRTLAWAPPSA